MNHAHLTDEHLKVALVAAATAYVPMAPEGWQREDAERGLERLKAAELTDPLLLQSLSMMRTTLEALPEPCADCEEVMADQRRLVRRLDVALNGGGAAPQASLCDVVGQVEAEGIRSRQYIETPES